MVAHHVHYAHDAVLIHYTHLRLHSVETSFLDGDVIVGMIDGVVDYMGYDEMIARQGRVDTHGVGIEPTAVIVYDLVETIHLKLKVGVTTLQILVYLFERK